MKPFRSRVFSLLVALLLMAVLATPAAADGGKDDTSRPKPVPVHADPPLLDLGAEEGGLGP